MVVKCKYFACLISESFKGCTLLCGVSRYISFSVLLPPTRYKRPLSMYKIVEGEDLLVVVMMFARVGRLSVMSVLGSAVRG